MSAPVATYNEAFGLVEIEPSPGHFLTPNEAYALYLSLAAILPKLPQPLNPDKP